MRLSITLILLACVSCVMAQSYNSGTKINEEERRRLENQFKALKTFYINDDGLVVYQVQEGDSNKTDATTPDLETTHTSNEETNDTSYQEKEEATIVTTNNNEYRDQSVVSTTTSSEVPVVNRVYETEGSHSQRYSGNNEYKPEETEKSQSYEAVTPSRTYETSAPNDVKPNKNVLSISKQPASPAHTTQDEPSTSRTEELSEAANEIVTETSLPEEQEVRLSPVSTSSTKQKEKDAELAEEIRPAAPSSSSSKKSIFEKNPSKYNNLEEAALAADALLEKLKKEQAQSSGSGSMSSRIARGAGGRSTLRKQAFTDSEMSDIADDQYGNDSYNPTTQGTSQSTNNFGDLEDYDIPTYYINGQKVDKAEVDKLSKLRKKDIISREIRTRNTVSGNPAGEIWYEVREGNIQ